MKQFIKDLAIDAGFSLCCVTTADPVDEIVYLKNWIESGYHSKMKWFERNPADRADPRKLLPSAKSVVCCGLAYGDLGLVPSPLRLATVNRARFARGEDYHIVIKGMLEKMWKEVIKKYPNADAKFCVDTSPIMEKALARRAGLGWIGKNTILINEKFGPWILLGEIITDLEIEPDLPVEDRCGDCNKCLSVCPTNALLKPFLLDSSKCISYLTIEQRNNPSSKYGCDICLESCPFSNIQNCK